MNQSSNRKSLGFVKHLEEISEDLKIATESAASNDPQAFLTLLKMYCAKKGMSHTEWEYLFGEQKLRQRLRQMGTSEGLVTEIVALTIQAVFSDVCSVGHFLPIDKQRQQLNCSICPEKPYKAMTIVRQKQGSDNRDAIVVVLCKEHLKRVQRHDVKLVHFISEQSKLHERPEN